LSPAEFIDPHFSEELCGFIQDALPNLDAVEILLFLRRHPDRPWSADALVHEVHPAVIARAVVAKHLELFLAQGLLSLEQGGYQYRPATPHLHEMVEALDAAYRERPVSLIRLIYFLKNNKIQSFADAFRIKKD
jgi:hypothetical protein